MSETLEIDMTGKNDEYPNRNNAKVTYSLPKEIIQRIEKERGDVSRSKFVLRLNEKGYGKQ